jgi:hypothetical protein
VENPYLDPGYTDVPLSPAATRYPRQVLASLTLFVIAAVGFLVAGSINVIQLSQPVTAKYVPTGMYVLIAGIVLVLALWSLATGLAALFRRNVGRICVAISAGVLLVAVLLWAVAALNSGYFYATNELGGPLDVVADYGSALIALLQAGVFIAATVLLFVGPRTASFYRRGRAH